MIPNFSSVTFLQEAFGIYDLAVWVKARPGQKEDRKQRAGHVSLASSSATGWTNYLTAKPETVGEAHIIGKKQTDELYILNSKCLINLNAMPNPNLFKPYTTTPQRT